MRHGWKLVGIMVMAGALSAFSLDPNTLVQGDGHVVDQVRTVDTFDSVIMSGHYAVHIVKGRQGLSVHADENVQPYLLATVSNHTLYLDTKTGYNINPSEPIVLTVSAGQLKLLQISGDALVTVDHLKSLESVVLSGSSNVTLSHVPRVHEFSMSGAGALTVSDVAASRLHLVMTGAGQAVFSGTAKQLNLSLSGAGQFISRDLHLVKATIEMSGATVALVNASDDLNVTLSGDSQLTYIGRPHISQRVFGVGQLIAG